MSHSGLQMRNEADNAVPEGTIIQKVIVLITKIIASNDYGEKWNDHDKDKTAPPLWMAISYLCPSLVHPGRVANCSVLQQRDRNETNDLEAAGDTTE